MSSDLERKTARPANLQPFRIDFLWNQCCRNQFCELRSRVQNDELFEEQFGPLPRGAATKMIDAGQIGGLGLNEPKQNLDSRSKAAIKPFKMYGVQLSSGSDPVWPAAS